MGGVRMWIFCVISEKKKEGREARRQGAPKKEENREGWGLCLLRALA